ncbi:Uncharacterized protein Fot_09249 [Forsythia ovata]|uniref:Uncharacterized protein n=1 Tax=Forsythia ovata TaxID=205694 RepID=A0ABD1WDH4_9LAMI
MVSEGLFFIYKSLGTRRGNNPSKNSQSSSPSSKPTKFIFQKFSPIMFIQIQASFRPKLQEILAKKFLSPRPSKKLGRTYLLGQQNQQNLGAEIEQTGGQRRDQNQQAGFESQAVTGTVFGVQMGENQHRVSRGNGPNRRPIWEKFQQYGVEVTGKTTGG